MRAFYATLAGIVMFLAIVGLILSTVVVGAQSVGVRTQFGKTKGVLEPGFHFISPLEDVEKFDGRIQNDVYNGGNTIPVRMGNDSLAQADVSIRWQLKTESAEQLFLDYREFDNIRANLVDRELRAALNTAAASYDPLDQEKDKEQALNDLAKSTQDSLVDKVGDKIEIHSVTIPLLQFDERTQSRIDSLQEEIANTRIAQQRRSTAREEAKANEELSNSLSNEVLTSKCLDIVQSSGQSPLGCFPGSSNQAIVNTTK